MLTAFTMTRLNGVTDMANAIADQAKRTRKGGSKAKSPSTGPIAASEVYTLDDFKRRTRWSDAALRTAKRRGLMTFREGNIGFIRGADFHKYLAKIAGETEAK
jgi:hypothetical protein